MLVFEAVEQDEGIRGGEAGRSKDTVAAAPVVFGPYLKLSTRAKH